MTTLDILIHQCATVLNDTPDAVLTVRADVQTLAYYNGSLVKVRGMDRAADNSAWVYRVSSETVAPRWVFEHELQVVTA